jgi:tetratricopeptide (TPR) repeat protein
LGTGIYHTFSTQILSTAGSKGGQALVQGMESTASPLSATTEAAGATRTGSSSRTRRKIEDAKDNDAKNITSPLKRGAPPPPQGPPPSKSLAVKKSQVTTNGSPIAAAVTVIPTSSSSPSSSPSDRPDAGSATSAAETQPPPTHTPSPNKRDGRSGDDDDDNLSVGDVGGDEEEDENLDADQAHIKELRVQGKMLEALGDLSGAEWAYQEALKIDPLNIKTLAVFAVFLHRKRGEMDRAAAFFGRALQQCLPSLFNEIAASAGKRKIRVVEVDAASTADPSSPLKSPISLNSATASAVTGSATTTEAVVASPGTSGIAIIPDVEPGSGGLRIKNRDLVTLLMKYASFLTRAQGDVEAATAIYKRAVEIEPNDSLILGSAAHFLASEGGDHQEALALYSRSLKADPSNALHALWYAKLLRKVGNLAQAEVMYKVAIQKSAEQAAQLNNSDGASKIQTSKLSSSSAVEASAICNYATFVYKQRKDNERALNLFEAGIRRFTTHKGLIKNYLHLLKAQPDLPPDPAVLRLAQTKPKRSKTNVLVEGAADN